MHMKTSNSQTKPHKGILWQEKAIRDGRGRPTVAGYSAAIRLHRKDFSSRGTSAWLYLQKTGRHHDVLSKLEKQVGMTLAYLGAVEMYEQYRLALTSADVDFTNDWSLPPGTQEICANRGIRHPGYSATSPRFMTTDWLIRSSSSKQFGCFVKYKNDVPRRGTREHDLALVQSEYWKARETGMYVVTEKHVDLVLIADLMWACDGGKEYPGGVPENFLDFLKQFDQERGLIDQLSQWRGRERVEDALLFFKAAVFAGQIRLTESRRRIPDHLPRLSDPRPFVLVSPSTRAGQLDSFFAGLEVFHA
jgi:hypothetical protein